MRRMRSSSQQGSPDRHSQRLCKGQHEEGNGQDSAEQDQELFKIIPGGGFLLHLLQEADIGEIYRLVSPEMK